MKIKFWGVRGSHSVCNKDFLKYGGNTTCLSVEIEDKVFVIDAGTGIVNFDSENSKYYREFNMLFTHVHIDHIQGFMFFKPLYSKSKEVHLYGPVFSNKNYFETIKELMGSNIFPVGVEAMYGIKSVNLLSENSKLEFKLKNGILRVYAKFLNVHPRAGVFVYKFEYNNKSFVFATDVESTDNGLEGLIEFSKDVDLLIHDGQYGEEEYRNKKGWGHSTINMAITNAKLSKAKTLCITHYSADNCDEFLDSEFERIKKDYPDIIFAREGLEINL